jgi:glycosyltransferase involved in cell wall biosynthesis
MTPTNGAPPGDAEVSALLVALPSDVWGAQRRMLDLAPRLRRHGVRLTLGTSPGSPFAAAWRAHDADAAFLPVELPAHRGLRRPDGSRAGPLALARELGAVLVSATRLVRPTRRADVVVSSDLNGYVETLLAARIARRPVVLEVVDLVADGMGRKLLRWATRRADLTVVNSTATERQLGHTSGVRLVHPGVDLDRFGPGPADPAVRTSLGGVPDAPLIGIVGRIDPEKGVDLLVRAVHRLTGAAAGARLVVVGAAGTHPQAAAYAVATRAEAERLLGSRVRFAGRRDDVPAVLRSLDVLVNASRAEPFGLTLLEAQACGIPVVASDAGGAPDFVIDGRTGLLFPPGDEAALAGRLQRLVDEPDLAARLAEAGLAQARARFSLADQDRTMAELYRAAARKGR